MKKSNLLVAVGSGLAALAFAAFGLNVYLNPKGGALWIGYALGFGMVLLMFVVNATSKKEAVKKERGWVVVALGLMAAIVVVHAANRFMGVDGERIESVIPYMVIVAASVILTIVAVKRRQNGSRS